MLLSIFNIPNGLVNMAEIISRTSDEITIQVTVKLTGSMLDMEQTIQQGVNDVGKTATKEALMQFETTGQNMQIGSLRLYCKEKVTKEYETPYGRVALDRYVYQGVKGGGTFCPLDQNARIVIHSTPKFAKMITSKYSNSSAMDVAYDLEQNHGRHVSKGFIQTVSDYVGSIAQASEEHWDYSVPEQKDYIETIAVSLDGTMMLMVGDGYREAMTGNISLYNMEGVRTHTIYVGASPEYGKQRFLERLQREIDRIKTKYPEAKYVGIADGAANNWKFLEPNTTYHILDFYHATEYLSRASYAFAKIDAERQKWLSASCHELKHTTGAAETLLTQMKQQQINIASKKQISQTIKDHLDQAITYFTNQLSRMDYPTYREANMPIGSGVTEAACKVLIKERLCKSGMKWKDQGAKTVLALRSLVKTPNRFEQFWQKMTQIGWDDLVLV